MLKNYESEIGMLTTEFDKKQLKKMSITTLSSLSEKLLSYENKEVEELMLELKDYLQSLRNLEQNDFKKYKKNLSLVKKLVKEEFNLHQKNSVIESYTAIGISIGIAVGAGISSITTSFIVVGIALGVAIGAGVGSEKEKVIKEDGRLY